MYIPIPSPRLAIHKDMDVLRDDRAGVIMGHDMFGANHHIISSLDDLPSWKPNSILLHDLFDHSLGYLGRLRRE